MRVEVDKLSCEANAVCVGIAPDVFQLDDEDVLHILLPEPPPELADQVREAVIGCPKLALTLHDDTTPG